MSDHTNTLLSEAPERLWIDARIITTPSMRVLYGEPPPDGVASVEYVRADLLPRASVVPQGDAPLFEAKLLGFGESDRITLCEPCLRQAIANDLVVFSCVLPAHASPPSLKVEETPVVVAEGDEIVYVYEAFDNTMQCRRCKEVFTPDRNNRFSVLHSCKPSADADLKRETPRYEK